MTTVLQIAAALLVLPILWLARKKKQSLFKWESLVRSQARSLQIIEHVRLTPNHSIHLVRLEDRTMIVAVDPSGCHLLGRGQRPGKTGDSLHVRGQGA